MNEKMIVIINYGLGNLGSMLNMLKKIGADTIISNDHQTIEKADKLILPGVGSFDAGMERLKAQGLIPVLQKRVLQEKIPILGVCLGMQLLGMGSEEGQLTGLGWLNAESIRFNFKGANTNLKIPHMGWNQLIIRMAHPLFAGLEAGNRFYFIHSYHVVCSNPDNILTTTSYGVDFTSTVVKNNIMGVQFHPEKSHKFGMRLLKNFSELV
jgi:imidazole glycerol-phosphate synthase subunit HisH